MTVGQTARLATGVSRAQAFVEGNKRTAFVVSVAFLKLNGLTIVGDPTQFSQQLDELADPSVTDDEADDRLDVWLRQRVAPRGTR
jgi:death-on-curing protein